MQTKNLVQACANVIRVTQLKKGDVYKRFEVDSYSESVNYGVITDLFNDGEKTYIEAVEYTKTYLEMSGKVKIFSGEKEIALFPTTVDEIRKHLADSLLYLERSIEDDKKKLHEKIHGFERAKEFISGESAKQLSVMNFTETPQSVYEAQKQLEARA